MPRLKILNNDARRAFIHQ